MNKQKVIDIAIGEVGYLEKSRDAYMRNPAVLYYKLDGAGYDNYTKYAHLIDQLNWYAVYVQGQPWCSTFIDAIFIECYGEPEAARMKNHGIYDALVDEAIESYKAIGRWFKTPEKGDQVFFSKANGIDPAHTGLVIDVDDTYVHTVEGNTSSQDGVDPAGGGVFRKKYRRDYYRLLGFGRPLYEEDDDMDVKTLMKMIKDASPEERRALGKELDTCVYEYRVKLECPEWAEDELQEAKDAGITDATRPMVYGTRLESAIMCKRAVSKR